MGAVAFGLLVVLERFFPLRQRVYNQISRIMVNLVFSACAFVIGVTLVRPVAIAMCGWSDASTFGFVHWLGLATGFEFVVAFLAMDLSFYYWHVLNHQWPILWRFHNIHHMDLDLDVTTGLRFHFVEVGLSSAFRAFQVTIIGISLETYFVYEICFQLATMFHHSNVQLPKWFEKRLQWIIVTPRMHGVHHSVLRNEANSNYSVIFSIWDRLHRTLTGNINKSQPRSGVPGYSDERDQRLWALVSLPFKRQRDYWRPNSPENQD